MIETILKPLIVDLIFVSVRLACSIFVPTLLGMKVIRCSTVNPGGNRAILHGDTEKILNKSFHNVEVALQYYRSNREYLTPAGLSKSILRLVVTCY